MDDSHDLDSASPVTMDLLARWVQSALRQLYDFPALEKHPLAELLVGRLNRPLNRAQELRRLLLEGIHAVRPSASTPFDAPSWRSYRILQMRYVEGLTPDEIMEQLALQKSQYYIDQSRALRILASRLWGSHQAQEGVLAQPSPNAPESLIRSETERLSAQTAWEEIDPGALLEELRRVLDPLVAAHHATLYLSSLPSTIKRAKRVLLRQAILNATSYALAFCPGGSIEIAGLAKNDRMGLYVRSSTTRSCSRPESATMQATRLEVCRQLMIDMGGRLEVHTTDAAWEAQLVWETAALSVLLVIDDNQGFAELFERYLAGHPWRVVGAISGAEAKQIIQEQGIKPTVIILDVLMPREDGWELLISLKADETTRGIPVIVCSVLHESSIAISLGAAAFLPKPVTEQALVQALAPWS